MKKQLLLGVACLLFSLNLNAQDFTYCYGSSESDVVAFEVCPSPGATATASICQGSFEDTYDDLTVYEGAMGSGTSGSVLLGPVDGDLTGTSISATAADQCLIFVVNSDGSVSCASLDEVELEVYIAGCPTCGDAASGTVANLTETSVDMGWTSNVNCTGDSYWVLPTGSPVPNAGTGTPADACGMTAVSGLTASTTYDAYIETTCAVGTAGPAFIGSFTTLTPPPTGSLCSDPIVVGSLPYMETGATTSGFGDDYTGSPGSSGCGTTSSYLNGDDIVYSFSTATNSSVDIIMTPSGTWSGIFVYADCADIGSSCLAGVGNSGSAAREILAFATTANTTYYIVISTFAAPQTVGYDLEISENTCIAPEATFAVVNDCDVSGGFNIDVDVTSLGSATSLTLSDGTSTMPTMTTGTVTFGPYTNGDMITMTVTNDQDGTCVVTSGVLTQAACPPTNTLCDGAIDITSSIGIASCGADVTGTNLAATDSGVADPSCNSGYTGGDIWYEVTLPAGGSTLNYEISASAFSSTILVLYSGSCGALIEEDCITHFPTGNGSLTTSSGGTHYIRAYDWSNNDFGDVTFCLYFPCDITSIVATPGNCNPADNTYSLDVIVTSNGTPTTGTLDVNGQSFAVAASPQTVTLTGLSADGVTGVDVTASFSDGCSSTETAAYDTPVGCSANCIITDLTIGTTGICTYDGTNATFTQEVTVSYVTPPASGTLDVTVGATTENATITTSPQVITVTGIPANGSTLDVTAVFSADALCTANEVGAVTAPNDCSPPPPPACDVNFSDSGGTTGDYQSGENIETIICPDVSGDVVTATFTSFEVEGFSVNNCWDWLYIYDGNSTAATPITPSSLGLGTGTSGFCYESPTDGSGDLTGVAITSTSADGCLTFNFTSDGSGEFAGWEADITCAPIDCEANTKVVLPTATTTATAADACTDGTDDFTYYDDGNGNYIFAVNWAPDGTISAANQAAKDAATVTIEKYTANASGSGAYEAPGNSSTEASFAMNTSWNVNIGSASMDEPVDVKFYYNTAEKTAVDGAAAYLGIPNPNGGAWYKNVGSDYDHPSVVTPADFQNNVTFLTDVSGGSSDNSVTYARFDGIVSFSGGSYGAGAGAGLLPVTLERFTAKADGRRNMIEWTTASEIDVQDHTLLKSDDATNWEVVGTQEGQINSTSNLEYEMMDYNPYNITYYQLMSTDIDGSKSYSGIVSVTRDDERSSAFLGASPVPTRDIVNLNVFSKGDDNITIILTDISGKRILVENKSISNGDHQLPLDLSNMTNGIYMVTITSDHIQQTHRVIKN